MLIVSVHFCPQKAYLFSRSKYLPFPHQRLKKTNNPLDDFVFKEDPISSPLPPTKQINVIMRGISFDHKQLENLKELTFLVNWPEKIENPNIVYATADQNDLKIMIEKEMIPLFFVQGMDSAGTATSLKSAIEKYILDGRVKRVFLAPKSNASGALSSGLVVIIALARYTQQINLYGFDFYQTKDLGKMSHWEALFALPNFIGGGPNPNSANIKHYPIFSAIPERALYTWHYAHRFNEIPGIKNFGFLANISKHKAITRSMDRIFYR